MEVKVAVEGGVARLRREAAQTKRSPPPRTGGDGGGRAGLSRGASRRRQRGRRPDRFPDNPRRSVRLHFHQGRALSRCLFTEENDLGQRFHSRHLLLLRFGRCNALAEIARVAAVEGLFHRHDDRAVPRVDHQHPRPRHRLQRRPMTAGGDQDGKRQEEARELGEGTLHEYRR